MYTDGSSNDEPGVDRIAGYGIATESGIRISQFVPTHLQQTNNFAELYAAVLSLKIVPDIRIAICTDSSCAILGA